MSLTEPRGVSATWQKRFDFFDAYGLPGSTHAAKAAYRSLPFTEKMRITSNVWAFVFGVFYFYVKGMWRKATTLLLVAVGLGVLLVMLPISDSIARGMGFGFAGGVMAIANFSYYLHRRGSASWNPLEGFGRRG